MGEDQGEDLYGGMKNILRYVRPAVYMRIPLSIYLSINIKRVRHSFYETNSLILAHIFLNTKYSIAVTRADNAKAIRVLMT